MSKGKRDWRVETSKRTQTCYFCGNSIEPKKLFFRDWVSGHLNAHGSCLEEHERKARK